ncbi:MAG TPA: amidohydrolase family protein [Armatimonadota bacterium]|nr:amidohydrolase family protein [Armatimonadota bacterium]
MRNDSQIGREFMATGRCESCPVIDMHGHYGPFHGIYLPRPWADGMLGTMDRSGVCFIVCSSHASLADPGRGNREMAQVVRDHPGRFYAYRTVNPNYPKKLKEEVARFPDDQGFVGFKFHPSGHSYPITGGNYVPALEYANEHRLLLLSHTWGFSEYDGPSLVAQVAERYPNATFLMGHSGYGEWDTALRVAGEHGNVYLELTAASRVSGVITRMVGEVGSEKVLFGTDLPWFDPHFGIGSVCFSRITDEDRHNILHRNAERLLAPFRARQED